MLLWQLPMMSQQPFGHDVASHMQPPETQRWPGAHWVPPGPHEQLVPTQRSASMPQATHEAPPVAQPTAGPGALQVLPAQQPLVHVEAQPAQMPLVQLSPAVHGVQAPPPFPHSVGEVPLTQAPLPSQQPFGHEVESQTQPPETQCWPASHAFPSEPHWQVPPMQLSALLLHVCAQVPPAGPQLAVPMGTQPVPLLQEFASHWQPPAPHT